MDLPPKNRIGTSGWSYDGWRGPFYPQGGSRKNWLGLYAETFNAVEVNNSFYRLPERKSVEGWVSATPQDFCFSVKASRYITHTKKLKTDGIEKFFAAIKPFGTKLGPVLFQLPPGWKLDLGRLEVFLKKLPAEYKYAFEFRNQSWLCEQVYDLLEKSGSALCFYDYRGFSSPEIITSDFISGCTARCRIRIRVRTKQAH